MNGGDGLAALGVITVISFGLFCLHAAGVREGRISALEVVSPCRAEETRVIKIEDFEFICASGRWSKR